MVSEQIIDISGPGEIEVPGDKSMTHRAIMLASLLKELPIFINHYLVKIVVVQWIYSDY